MAIYFLDNIYIIKALREFEFVDEHGEDHGQTVRQWAADIVNLLRDDGRLRRERQSHAPKRFRTVSGPKNYDDDDSDCATDPFSDDASTPSVSFLASIHVSTSNHFVAAKARGLQGHSRDLTTLETYGNSGLLPDLSGFDRSQPWSILLDTLLNSVKNLLSCGFSMSYLVGTLLRHCKEGDLTDLILTSSLACRATSPLRRVHTQNDRRKESQTYLRSVSQPSSAAH